MAVGGQTLCEDVSSYSSKFSVFKIQALICVFYATLLQMSPLEIQQAALEGLALPHDLAIQAANFYQHGFGKPQMDKSRDGYRNR